VAFRDIYIALFPNRRDAQFVDGAEPPLQAEIFGIDRLEPYARTLAESDRVDGARRVDQNLRERFQSNRRALFASHAAFSDAARERQSLPPAAEWLLDNFYAVQGQLQQIDRDLSRGYYRELPKLSAGPYAGYPRVYGLAVELVSHTDSRLDGEIIERFVQAYQAVAPLNAGEVWAVALMLRVALIENLRRLISQARVSQQRRGDAARWASRLLRLASESRSQYVIGMADLAQAYRALDSVFVVHLLEQLRDQSPVIAPVVTWLETLLTEQGTTLEAVIHAEHQQRAANRISVGNAITSLRTLSVIDWAKFFEATSVLEAELRRDPLDVYSRMDFDTRDRYRHVVERLSRRTGLDETEVARRAVAHGRRYLTGHARPALPGAQPDLRQAHIGYYLLDKGARELEADIRYQPSLLELAGGAIRRHVNVIYLGGLLSLTILFVEVMLDYAGRHGLSPLGLLGLAMLITLPASALGANVLNYWVTITVPPQRVPKLDFHDGLPAEFSTMVVVPCLISSESGIKRLFDKLEIRYLANRDEHLYFALLGDFADSPQQQQSEDALLLDAARQRLEALNAQYGRNGVGPFYFFHRVRCWNEAEEVWMGWERKRGKLMELNRLLRGGTDTSFAVQWGDLSVLKQIRFVLTLDADTELPINAARRLAGAMAHPLNRPIVDPNLRRVVDGYGILQPRVAVTANAATSTAFARIFAGESGLDPYSAAVSTVYQDLFGAGDYIGKAIYDVEVAAALLHRRFPENLLLSHDLLEGSYLRTGQVTEVQLLEDFPSGYDAFIQRQHRWVRGDWQITAWLLPLVPSQGGRRQRNPLSLISRWRVFDNLRRSLVGATVVLLLGLAWTILPGSAWVWTGAALLPILLPDLTGLILNSGVHPRGEPWLAYFRGVARDLSHSLREVVLLLAFLLHIALMNVNALALVLVRRLFTHRRLLEWTSAAAAEHGQARTIRDYWSRMWVAPLLAAALLGLTALLRRAALLPAAPVAGLWLLSPFIAYWVSQPAAELQREALPPEAHHALRLTARRIWQFYQTFAGAEDNYLPPDNFQLEPGQSVAHRTSPTNIGFLLLSALAAYDFGYLDGLGLAERLEQLLATLDQLQRYRGHFLNWYDTRTLRPLLPEYVSTVDSGNLAACLIVLRQFCLQMASAPLLRPEALEGFRDTLTALDQALHAYQPAGNTPRAAISQMSSELGEVRTRLLGGVADAPAWTGLLADLKEAAVSILARAQALAGIAGNPDPADVREWAAALRDQAAAWQALTQALGVWPGDGRSLAALAAGAGATQAVAAALCDRYQALAQRAEALSTAMDFTFLYDHEREVFVIGYHPVSQQLDNSFYDLLSSEARVASFVAIANGQIPARHWFRLGRPLAWSGGSLVSLSWSGTMFEYLMPGLLMMDFPNSLLEQTSRAVVREQQAYGAQHHVPWGVSESGFYAFDHQFVYQYQAFGVPSLGLKRELAENVVIAPYATFLALQVDPSQAWANLQALAAAGAHGNYGYFEALDYTPARRPRGEPVGVVRSYMAHHQGMSLVALDNFLHDGVMRRRFHAERTIAAIELLLQEQVPRHVPLLDRQAQAESEAEAEIAPGDSGASTRSFVTPHTLTPRTHWLSNSAYEVMITNAGGGYSAYHEPGRTRPLAITRWRPDIAQDAWGSFIYIQDTANDRLWSATYQPAGREAELYEVTFAMDRAQFRRRDQGIETRLEIIVSPRDNAEIRRVTLTNLSRRPRTLALTSYVEVALADPAADLAHPAFSKLFIESEFVPEQSALFFRRRPREDGELGAWLMHLLVPEQPLAGALEYETDRARFIGRGRTLRRPEALEHPLSNTVGAVLDPVMSLRGGVQLAPGAVARFVFVTGVAESRATLLDLAQRFADPRTIGATLDLAWVYSQIQLRSLNISDDEAHQFQRLASRVIFPDRSLRAPQDVLAQNTRGQSALWAYGISGDNPIVLVRVDENEELDLVRQALRAQEYWRLNHFVVDLVILNEHATSYSDGLQGQIQAIIDSSLSLPYQDKPGGFFVRRADQMPAEDRTLLATVARVVFTSEQGSLFDQLNRIRDRGLPQLRPARRLPAAEPSAPVPVDQPARQMDNGLGGFSPDGREYRITLAEGAATPAPWSNVLANENFGCLLTELGLGCTWAENSQLNRLTPWTNDPVSDPPGEALYILDDESGQAWSATPLPMRAAGGETYRIAHGAGYSRYERTSHGLAHELTVFVPRSDPVKVMRLRLRNLDRQSRRLAITGYAEWVLGVSRSQTQYFIVTERHPRTGAILARNRYNSDFGQRLAFAHLINITPQNAPRPVARGGQPAQAAIAATGDRIEFIGRNSGLDQPAGLERPTLSGTVGAGLDPCAAVQARLTLRPGETAELVFLIGEGQDMPQVNALLERYADAGRVQSALDEVVAFWDELLGAVVVHTPEPAFDLLVNRWLLYQALACRIWGRTAFYQSGGAYGFRDQLQDVLGLLHVQPAVARQHLLLAASRQFVEGDVQHWWHPTTSQGVRTRISDDYLWLVYCVETYVTVTGDKAILDEPVPYLKGSPLPAGQLESLVVGSPTSQTGSLYEHCQRALDHGLSFGPHGLPLMGTGDWNDGMNRVGPDGKGESIWLGWFLLANLKSFSELAEARGDTAAGARWRAAQAPLQQALETHGWDGAWYKRAYFDDGTPLGSAQNEECQIDSIAQSWAVISGGAPPEHARQALAAAWEKLVRAPEALVALLSPPFDHSQPSPGYIQGYIPGTRENSGQYTHAALWLILAHVMRGDGDRAAQLFRLINPLNHARTPAEVERYKVEPYVVAADVYSHPAHLGRGGWTWYTGSAAWMYRVALEGILGLRRRGASLSLEPCLPGDWPRFTLSYLFGKTRYEIQVERGDQPGTRLDGQPLPDGTIPLVDDGQPHQARVVLAKR
jgi:cyclic beta-1,2-glucan synthetase